MNAVLWLRKAVLTVDGILNYFLSVITPMKLPMEQVANLESEILKRVRAYPGIPRITLAKDLQVAPSTVGSYVARLCIDGFLVEAKQGGSESGRPPTALRLNPEGGQFIGVDFEARNIMAMAVDFSDTPLKHVHKTIEEGETVAQILRKIEEAIADVFPTNSGRLLAIGVGVPGLVDAANGIALRYKHIKQWNNVALAEPLAKKFGVPVFLENCVRSMALAEMWFGHGRGQENFLCIGIRSGVGAGIVAGGQLQRGVTHHAGEIGRWRMPWPALPQARFFADPESSTDAELEEVASVRAIVEALARAQQAKEKTILSTQNGPIRFSDVVRAAQLRDPLTLQIVEVAADMLGRAVSQLIFALNPARVILAGPLTLLGGTLLYPLRERVASLLGASDSDMPAIVNSTMGEYNGALGAAALAVHEWKPAR
jgi:predicted NBD/HSP70 family sugar kinase